jgi:AraC-like DNA-binding protein
VLRDYIEMNISEPGLSAEHLAKAFHMSRATVYRLFEAEGGVTNFIIARRLERSILMLTSQDKPRYVGEIAFGLGFASEAHFSRKFRQRFGMSPREARNLRANRHFAPAANKLANWLSMVGSR